jgi:membrane protease YdiL (CAAX protease family)
LYAILGLIFTVSARWLGKDSGYLLGFAFYWLLFGVAAPLFLLGPGNFASLVQDRSPLFSRSNWLAAAIWLIITLVTILMYGREFINASLPLILLSVPLATLNGLGEELFWRGIFVKAFPTNPWLGIIYPSVGFALWHLIPVSLFPVANLPGFILSTFFLGLAYGFIAYRTGSARWTIISHSLNGLLALSGMLAPTLLKLIAD